MPKNLKKLIDQRRAKTGESYQTALRHVRNQRPSKFELLIRRLIQLAKARQDEYDARPNKKFDIKRFFGPRPPCEAALRSALTALSSQELRKVEVLMYSGRDRENVHDIQMSLLEDSHDVTVHVIMSKSPLVDYLEAGLMRAQSDNIDLDADF